MKILKLLLISLVPLVASDAVLEQIINLTIDSKEYKLSTVKENSIKLNGKEHKIYVKMAPYFSFKHKDLEFKFNSSLNFSYDASNEEEGLKSWSINGDNISIMVMEYNKHFSKNQIIDSITNEYKAMKAKMVKKDTKLTLNSGKSISGISIVSHLGNIVLYQNIFILYGKNNSFAFILQDILDNNKHTLEYKNMLDTINNSLDIKELREK